MELRVLRKYGPQERFVYFIKTRERARIHRDLMGAPMSVEEDALIGQYKFCNINREHDRVTRWIDAHVRKPLTDGPADLLVRNILIARIFNQPFILAQVLPVSMDITDIGRAINQLHELKAHGDAVFRGAYMMPVHGAAGGGRSAVAYYMAAVSQVRSLSLAASLETVADALMEVNGLGDFLANQVATDLRYTERFKNARDWFTFIRCGPGTRRGLDRWMGARSETIGIGPQADYCKRLLEVREILHKRDDVPPPILGYFNDPNNLANSFCEWDKYERALWRKEGERITLRKFSPHVTE